MSKPSKLEQNAVAFLEFVSETSSRTSTPEEAKETLKKFKQSRSNYIVDYQKQHYKKVDVRLNQETDSDIINHLETVGNKTDYIKQLIRQDMESKK